MSADLDLSRRAIAAGWRWQAGALALPEVGGIALRAVRVRIVQAYEEGGLLVAGSTWSQGKEIGGLWEEYRCTRLPDFNDAATRGVLLAQVRERWGDCSVWAMVDCDDEAGSWLCIGLDCGQVGAGPTETAALIAALEAAPERK